MAIVPFAVWRPVLSHSGVMTAHQGLVLHVQVGNGSCYGEFATPSNQASSTWWISKAGVLEQYVDSDAAAWTEAAGNFTWDSVETEGEPTEPLTQAQVLTLVRLYVWGVEHYGWPLQLAETPGARGLGWHGMGGGPWGGHLGCPGDLRKAQRVAVIYLAALVLHPSSPTTTGPSEVPMLCQDPTSGGTWIVDTDGHIETLYGSPYLGGLNEPVPDRNNWKEVGIIWGITPWKDGTGAWGYAIIVKHFQPLNGGWFSGYTFERSGGNR